MASSSYRYSFFLNCFCLLPCEPPIYNKPYCYSIERAAARSRHRFARKDCGNLKPAGKRTIHVFPVTFTGTADANILGGVSPPSATAARINYLRGKLFEKLEYFSYSKPSILHFRVIDLRLFPDARRSRRCDSRLFVVSSSHLRDHVELRGDQCYLNRNRVDAKLEWHSRPSRSIIRQKHCRRFVERVFQHAAFTQ